MFRKLVEWTCILLKGRGASSGRRRGKTYGSPAAMMRQSGYFFAPDPLPGFKMGVDPAVGFGFSALGFFGSRLLLFWPLAMLASQAGKSAILAPLSLYTLI